MEKKRERQNPYDYTNAVTDMAVFAGRQKEIEEIEYCLNLSLHRRPVYMNMALIGERASGKTSLLNKARHLADAKGFLTAKINLDNSVVQNDINFFAEIINGIMLEGCRRGMYDGLTGRVYQTFRVMQDMLTLDASVVNMAHVRLQFPALYIGTTLRKEYDRPIPQHILLHDFCELYREAQERGIPAIVLLFDECDLFSLNETLLQKIRNLFSECKGYVLVFAGTEKMFPKLQEVFSPVPRQFKKIPVGNFSSKREVMECVLKPLATWETTLLTEETLSDLDSLSGGNPYELQLVCFYMYQRYEREQTDHLAISREVLENVYSELERLQKKGEYKAIDLTRELTEAEVRFLSKFLRFENLTIPEILVYEHICSSLHEVPIEKESPLERTRSNFLTTVEPFSQRGLVIVDSDNDQVTLAGDAFEKLYMKYHVRAVHPDIRWTWDSRSLSELVLLDEVFRYLLKGLGSLVNGAISAPDKAIPSSLARSDLSKIYQSQLLSNQVLSIFEKSSLAEEDIIGTVQQIVASLRTSDSILYAEKGYKDVLGLSLALSYGGEKSQGYLFCVLHPDANYDLVSSEMASCLNACQDVLSAFGIKLVTLDQQHVADTELPSFDELVSSVRQEVEAGEEFSPIQEALLTAGADFYADALLELSLDAFRLVVEGNPKSAIANNNLGFLLMEVEDYDLAVEHLLKAIELGFEDEEITYCDLGYLYLKQGDLQEAEESLEQAIAITSAKEYEEDEREAFLRVAFAVEEYDDLLDFSGQKAPSILRSVAAYLNLAVVYALESRWEEALAACHQAKSARPYAIVYQVLSSVYYAMGRLEDASEYLRCALECEPGDMAVAQLLEMLAASEEAID